MNETIEILASNFAKNNCDVPTIKCCDYKIRRAAYDLNFSDFQKEKVGFCNITFQEFLYFKFIGRCK